MRSRRQVELTLKIIFIKRLCKKAVLISYNSHVRFVHRPCTIRTLALYHSYMAIIRNENGSVEKIWRGAWLMLCWNGNKDWVGCAKE